MPKSPAASKREIRTALSVAERAAVVAGAQKTAFERVMPVMEQVASDAEVSKGILSRPFLGRCRWFFLGR